MEWILTIFIILSNPTGAYSKQETTQVFDSRVKCEKALKEFYDKTTEKSFVASCEKKESPVVKK